jgi:hypothetical protein
LAILASACGGGTNIATEQTNCTKITACVESGEASASVDHIEDLAGTQFHFVSGISYPVKIGSVWTLRLQFINEPTKASLEDDVRNMPDFQPCGGSSHVVEAARTPGGRDVCIEPLGTSTFLWYKSEGLIHTVYLLPPMPKINQKQVEKMLFGYVDALR